jgi:hypothetical protein
MLKYQPCGAITSGHGKYCKTSQKTAHTTFTLFLLSLSIRSPMIQIFLGTA